MIKLFYFIVGLFVGNLLGILTMCLCIAAKEKEEVETELIKNDCSDSMC